MSFIHILQNRPLYNKRDEDSPSSFLLTSSPSAGYNLFPSIKVKGIRGTKPNDSRILDPGPTQVAIVKTGKRHSPLLVSKVRTPVQLPSLHVGLKDPADSVEQDKCLASRRGVDGTPL